MFGAAGLMGGGGLSTSSSSSAESSATGGKVGDIGFGDNIIGGLKFSPVTLGIVGAVVVLVVWLWKR